MTSTSLHSTPQITEAEQLTAAASVFREHGFGRTSIQMLVDATGASRTVLYNRFGDKSGIFLAALRHYCHTDANFAFVNDPGAVVQQAAAAFARDAGQHPCLLTRSCSELDQLPDGSQEIVLDALKRQWNQLTECASRAEGLPDGEALRVATQALVHRHGLASLAASGIPSDQVRAVLSMLAAS